MRVKILDSNELGEIEEIYDNELLIKYTDGSNTGWNAQCEYKTKKVNCNNIIILDNGLNSPWILNINTLEQYIFTLIDKL